MNDKTNEPGKLNLESHHIADDKREELLRLFPEIRTEDGTTEIRGQVLSFASPVATNLPTSESE